MFFCEANNKCDIYLFCPLLHLFVIFWCFSVPSYLSRGPPVLLHPEKVVPLSQTEQFERSYQPNVALAPPNHKQVLPLNHHHSLIHHHLLNLALPWAIPSNEGFIAQIKYRVVNKFFPLKGRTPMEITNIFWTVNIIYYYVFFVLLIMNQQSKIYWVFIDQC
jgi:hypothetical protein